MKGWLCALPLPLAGLVFPRGLHLGLCSPAPTRNPQQEKQCCSMKETQVRNGIAAGSTHVEEMYVKSREQPKDQREDSADQT